MKSLIQDPCGDERSVIIRNLDEPFFGTTPTGDVRKFGNGGFVKGPVILFSDNSVIKLLKIASGLVDADDKLLEINENWGPEYPILKPNSKLLIKLFTKRLSG